MKISTFVGKSETDMKFADAIREINWNDLPSIITSSPWSPGTFNEMHRTKETFQQMELFVADIDKGCTIEDAKRLFANYKCIIATTKSHQKEKVKKSGKKEPPCDRFRVVVPLTEPILSDKDFKATWGEVQKLCGSMDKACKDSSRFYWPCVEVVAQWDGAPITPTKFVPKAKTPKAQLKPGERGLPSKRTMAFLLMGPSDKDTWHHEFVTACYDLKQQGWTQEDATEALTKVTGELDEEHDLPAIEDIWNNRKPKYETRIDTVNPLRNLIMKCQLIENVSNPNERTLLDMEQGRNYDIHIMKIQEILGQKEFDTYQFNNKIHANFDYCPYLKPLTRDPSTGVYIYNSYRPAEWRAREFWFDEPTAQTQHCPEIFDRFFTHLTDGDGASKEYLLDWMANSLRTRNFTILTAIGTQGAGKGILATIFRHLHGESNFAEVTDGIFKERFNGAIKNKTLINVDELGLKTKEDHDRLKAVVNEYIVIEEKGVDARTYRNWASFYITSNHLDAIQLEPGDRRFSLIRLARKKLIDTELRAQIPYLTSPEAIFELGKYLFGRKITHDMLTPFRSSKFDEVRDFNLNDWESFMIHEFCPQHAGKTLPLKFVIDSIKDTLEMRKLGRPGLERLQAKYPEKFTIIQNPKNRAERMIEFAPA